MTDTGTGAMCFQDGDGSHKATGRGDRGGHQNLEKAKKQILPQRIPGENSTLDHNLLKPILDFWLLHL